MGETMGERFKRLQGNAHEPDGYTFGDMCTDPAFADYVLGLEIQAKLASERLVERDTELFIAKHERSEAKRRVDELTTENAQLRERVRELEEDAADHKAGFDLRWNADMRAIKRWQAATGRTLTWPDHADLCVWLLEKLDAIEGVPSDDSEPSET